MSWLFSHVYLKTDSPMPNHGVEFIVQRADVINYLSEIMDSYCCLVYIVRANKILRVSYAHVAFFGISMFHKG